MVFALDGCRDAHIRPEVLAVRRPSTLICPDAGAEDHQLLAEVVARA